MRHEREAVDFLTVLALVLGLLLIGKSLGAHTPESAGISWDKALHFSVGYIATDATERVTRKWWAGVAVSAALASAKEASDSRWDWQDWTATMLGSGAKLTLLKW